MEISKNAKITVFGDSVPKGVVSKDSKISVLEDNVVSLIAKHYNIEIKNQSVYGQTLKRICEKGLIDNYLSQIKRRDKNIVILSIGGNDADFNWEVVDKTPEQNHQSKTTVEDFILLLSETISKLNKKKVKVVLTSIPPVNAQRYFEEVISKRANKDNILKFFNNDISNIYRYQEAMNMAITKCASKHNCKLIDFRTNFLMQRDYSDLLYEDGVHPNQEGHKFMAKIIIDQIDNWK